MTEPFDIEDEVQARPRAAAERAAAARQARLAVRQELAERRRHGLRARHAHKLSHADETEETSPTMAAPKTTPDPGPAQRLVRCRMLVEIQHKRGDITLDRCTAEVLDPHAAVLICAPHASEVMRLINAGLSKRAIQ